MQGFWRDCPECQGSGTVERETYHRDMISARDVPCDNCGGSGEVLIDGLQDLLDGGAGYDFPANIEPDEAPPSEAYSLNTEEGK